MGKLMKLKHRQNVECEKFLKSENITENSII